MRIDRLTLTDFRNLVDFKVDFDETSNRQVVVGRNGVGKSNLLEALTWIFRDLDLEEDSEFGYEIEYLCNGYFVKVALRRNLEQPLISWGILILGNSGYSQRGARERLEQTAGVARLPRVPARNR